MRRAWTARAAVVAGAVCAAGAMSPLGVAWAGTARVGAAGGGPLAHGLSSTAHSLSWPTPPREAHAAHACPLPVFGPGRSYHPKIDRRSFTPDVTNPLFPLVVGRTMIYSGVKDGKRAVDVVVASRRTRRIDGVVTRVVEDRLYLNGLLQERTRDYYAQDRCGNVWYFGEDTAELDGRGRVTSTEGSFHAGVNGARPGVVMERHREVGRWLRQEWLAGQAEDRFRVVSLRACVTVPYGRFARALRTEERSALEPDVVDAKFYMRGVGEVYEGAVRGPKEELRLVEIIS
jgi:hypothetical protein